MNDVVRTLLLRATCLLLIPPCVGLFAGSYRAVAFFLLEFTPQDEPLHVTVVQLGSILLAGVAVAVFAARPLFAASLATSRQRGRLPAAAAMPAVATTALALGFLYVVLRTSTVEEAIVRQFAYCCCCESQPTASETWSALLNPIKLH
jgi:hypothetical protein